MSVKPGRVMISCGCQPDDKCPQGRARCHMWMDELDLLRITNDIVVARFKSAREAEKGGETQGPMTGHIRRTLEEMGFENPERLMKEAADSAAPNEDYIRRCKEAEMKRDQRDREHEARNREQTRQLKGEVLGSTSPPPPNDCPTSVSGLILEVERMFQCHVGPQRAYFEWNGEHGFHRAVYTTLKLGARLDGTRDWSEELIRCAYRVFEALQFEGATRIVWRLGQRIEMERVHQCESGGEVLKVYTRFAALRPDGTQVRVPENFGSQREGLGPLILSPEQLEDGRI